MSVVRSIEDAIARINGMGWMIGEIGEYERGRVPREQRWFAAANPSLDGVIDKKTVLYGNGANALGALAILIAEIENHPHRHALEELLDALQDNLDGRSS